MTDIMFVVKSGDGYVMGLKDALPLMTTDLKEAAQFKPDEAADMVLYFAQLGFSSHIEPILVTE